MVKNRDWLKKVGEWLINQSTEENINQASYEILERLNEDIKQLSQEKEIVRH